MCHSFTDATWCYVLVSTAIIAGIHSTDFPVVIVCITLVCRIMSFTIIYAYLLNQCPFRIFSRALNVHHTVVLKYNACTSD